MANPRASNHYVTNLELQVEELTAEIKELPHTAPVVHNALNKGAFVGRRADGHHNEVSPDILLEQTYNADAKGENGLECITTNYAARTK